jgi:glycosyltransferase involved in cell wall biosynthesis
MLPTISIITPSYNQGRFIERTVQSVVTQAVPGLEYVVMDGGSTDETLEILRRYEQHLRWTSEKDRGHSHAINKGICRTTGPIIGWLNSDDIYYPDALQTVLAYFDAHRDVEVVYGDAHHIDEHDSFIEDYPTQDWDFRRLADICFISQPATFVRRSVFERHGLLDEGLRYSMDYDLWLRLGVRGVRFAHLPRVLAATRLHADAFTIAHKVRVHASINDITRRHLGRTPDRWLLNYAHAVTEQGDAPRSIPRLVAVAVWAALRWNRRISADMLATLARWLVADALRPLRRRRRPV